MATRPELVQKCRALRRGGATLGEIVTATGLPKTTVFDRICDIPLPFSVQARIKRERFERLKVLSESRKGKCLPGRELVMPTGWSDNLIFLLSHFMFDGSVGRHRCEYYNRSDHLIREMQRVMHEVFGLHTHIRKRDFGVKQLAYFHVELAAYVQEKSVQLLSYIIRASMREKRVFLRSFFDDEGCVSVYGKHRRVRGYQYNSAMLQLIHGLLGNFDIQSSVYPKNHEITIRGKHNFIRFRDEINFSKGVYINPYRKNSVWKKKLEKRKILDMAIASYQS